MILVAFVLVLFATVMLIIGTFFDTSTAYIWISIGACLATFVVLAISYMARRRGRDDEAARPAPLAADTSRSPATPRASSSGGTATMVREEPTTEVDEDEEPSVTIVPGERDTAAAGDEDRAAADVEAVSGDEEPVAEDSDEDVAEEAPAPAPRRVAPRRVVRRAAPAAAAPSTDADAGEPESEAPEATPAPAQPRIVATSPRPSTSAPEPVADEHPEPTGDESTATPAEPAQPPAAAEDAPAPTRKVVRRVATSDGGTKKVVRRVASSGDGARRVVRRTGSGTTASGTTRRVVRRTAAGTAAGASGTRTVKRVVRSTSVSGEKPAGDKPATSNRTGTRGKRARAVLSEIKGVGPAKQDALLKKFGSLENMAEASVDDLAAIKGVGEASAAEIKRVLQAR